MLNPQSLQKKKKLVPKTDLDLTRSLSLGDSYGTTRLELELSSKTLKLV